MPFDGMVLIIINDLILVLCFRASVKVLHRPKCAKHGTGTLVCGARR
jgi:hypothetical protein